MHGARLLILAFCMGFSLPGFATTTHPALNEEVPTGNVAEPVKAKLIITARSLAVLVRNNRRVQVKAAIIRGALDLSYMTINQQLSLVNCEFEDPADFSYSAKSLMDYLFRWARPAFHQGRARSPV